MVVIVYGFSTLKENFLAKFKLSKPNSLFHEGYIPIDTPLEQWYIIRNPINHQFYEMINPNSITQNLIFVCNSLYFIPQHLICNAQLHLFNDQIIIPRGYKALISKLLLAKIALGVKIN